MDSSYGGGKLAAGGGKQAGVGRKLKRYKAFDD